MAILSDHHSHTRDSCHDLRRFNTEFEFDRARCKTVASSDPYSDPYIHHSRKPIPSYGKSAPRFEPLITHVKEFLTRIAFSLLASAIETYAE